MTIVYSLCLSGRTWFAIDRTWGSVTQIFNISFTLIPWMYHHRNRHNNTSWSWHCWLCTAINWHLPNPMSNILSASSNTRYVHLCRLVAFFFTKSIKRPWQYTNWICMYQGQCLSFYLKVQHVLIHLHITLHHSGVILLSV